MELMNKKIFTEKELRSLSDTSQGFLDFDLSSIDINYWEAFQNTLIQLGKTTIKGIGFNLKTCAKAMQEIKLRKKLLKTGKTLHHPPIAFEASVQHNNPRLIPELVGLLSRIIPRSTSLSLLSFVLMPFGFVEIDILTQSICQCKYLRVLRFDDVPLHDNGFIRLSEALKRQAVQELQCRRCGLTDNIKDTFLELVATHVQIQRLADRKAELNSVPNLGTVCLSLLDFSDNNLTDHFVRLVQESVEHSPIVSLDLTGNKNIRVETILTSKILVRNTEMEGKETITSLSFREKVLSDENKRLRKTVEALVQGRNVTALRSDLYAIGPRANELARHIEVLDQLCEDIDEMDSETTQTSAKKTTKKKLKRTTSQRMRGINKY